MKESEWNDKTAEEQDEIFNKAHRKMLEELVIILAKSPPISRHDLVALIGDIHARYGRIEIETIPPNPSYKKSLSNPITAKLKKKIIESSW